MDRVTRAIDGLLRAPAVAARRVAAVWLFGSHAAGTASERSDVDLAILCEPPLGNDRFAVLEHAAAAAGVEVDVIDLATIDANVAWEVVTTGRIVVERDELALEQFVRHARFAAEDAARRHRMIVLAATGAVGGARR